MALGLVVDAELFRLDAVVRWLDAADGRIKRTAASSESSRPPASEKPGPPVPVRKLRRRAGAGR
jgi:hypothetical protein